MVRLMAGKHNDTSIVLISNIFSIQEAFFRPNVYHLLEFTKLAS